MAPNSLLRFGKLEDCFGDCEEFWDVFLEDNGYLASLRRIGYIFAKAFCKYVSIFETQLAFRNAMS
jgi:hypothetical protein